MQYNDNKLIIIINKNDIFDKMNFKKRNDNNKKKGVLAGWLRPEVQVVLPLVREEAWGGLLCESLLKSHSAVLEVIIIN